VRVTARRQRGAAFALAQDLISSLAMTLPLEAANAGVDAIVWPHATAGDTQRMQAVPAEDSVEQRALANQQLTDLVCNVARARPLLLAVDDFERADEFSIALITGLARQAATLPLAIVLTETEGHDEANAVGRTLHGISQAFRLEELSLAGTSAL
jgi:predicted ATPase